MHRVCVDGGISRLQCVHLVGRQTCSNKHRTEYTGLVMNTHYTQQAVRAICVDVERAIHSASNFGDDNSALLLLD